MKITRKKTGKQILKQQKSKKKQKLRYVSQTQQISYSQILDETVNNPMIFSYADYNRNYGRIELLKTRFDDMIRINGVDLAYFRKFNTFYQDDQHNTSNMIYGQDTTAQFYLSGDVRAYLSINKQDFAFNMMGYEATQQIQIYMTIEDFRSRFSTVIGTVSSQIFTVPVTGDVYHHQYYGKIDIPEFYAQIYGNLNTQTLYINDAHPIIKPRSFNSKLYNSLDRIAYLQPLTGVLSGQLNYFDETNLYAKGIVSGQLTYHSLNNIENSPGWNIAPQVGDYFKLKKGQIEEQYQINQVLDKQLTKEGLNPLLGRYIFKCLAVRRTPSYQQHNNIAQTDINAPFDDMNFFYPNKNNKKQQEPQQNYSQYNKKQKKKNVNNKRNNKLAKNIFNYKQNEDSVYGGYNPDVIPSNQNEYFHETQE